MYLIGRLLTGSVNLVVDTTLHTPYTPKGAVSHRMSFDPDPGSRHLEMANIYSYSFIFITRAGARNAANVEKFNYAAECRILFQLCSKLMARVKCHKLVSN